MPIYNRNRVQSFKRKLLDDCSHTIINKTTSMAYLMYTNVFWVWSPSTSLMAHH
uniref:Uncharacterized protein n=1 Tax=Nelumbo nucifera TaxID=4432 RepID=A0A822ZP40_NELNU|nr:TPA_asm: hypothetical protein HUJ06_003531 [Nelumbo nucifera]